jgi:hypothetical protein
MERGFLLARAGVDVLPLSLFFLALGDFFFLVHKESITISGQKTTPEAIKI